MSGPEGPPPPPGADRGSVAGGLPLDAAAVRDALEALHARNPGPRQATTRRIGAATRMLIDRLMATSAPEDVLGPVADRLEALTQELGGYHHDRLYEGYAESSIAGRPSAFFDWSPVLGVSNPLAPPVAVRVEGEEVVGDVRFGAAYEGPPGCVHGGYLAAAFDEVLGLAQMIGGHPAMTGRLEVVYRKPTPLQVHLQFSARTVARRGRTVTVEGECRFRDSVTAEARAVFVQVPVERFALLLAEREGRHREGGGEPAGEGPGPRAPEGGPPPGGLGPT